jgi:hypothetical protein
MFRSHEKFSGRQHTRWFAFLLAAFVTSIGLVATAPHSTFVMSLTLLVSVLFFGLAWTHWNKHSDLTIPSLDLR